jgi:hypothetical protein
MSTIEERIKEAEAKGEVIDLSAIAAPKEEHFKADDLPQFSRKGRDPRKVHYFVPEEEKKGPKEKWPVFHYRIKNGIGWQIEILNSDLDIERLEGKSKESRKIQLDLIMEILRNGLVGWSNFKDDEEDPIPFEVDSEGKPTLDTINSIPFQWVSEIANAITRGLKLTKEERTGIKF